LQGQQIGEGIAFAKIEDEEIQKQIDKLATKVANKAEKKIVEPEKKRFSLMILLKWICVGTIIEASKMPKANKLLILK
jgi:methionyl-tRNA synthetase